MAAAIKDIKKELSGLVLGDMTGKADEGMERAGKAADKLATKINKVSEAARAMKQRMADIASGKLSPVQSGMKVSGIGEGSGTANETEEERLKRVAKIIAESRAAGLKPLSYIPGTLSPGTGSSPLSMSGQSSYSGPTPPLIPPPIIPKQQTVGGMIQGVLNTTVTPFTKMALGVTAALAGLRVAIGLIKYAFSLLLIPLNYLIKQAEAAARMYAKSLTSGGLPVGFSTRRQLLAEVIGVSEQEVLKFSKAIKTLGDGMIASTAAIADAVPTLTTIGWEWRMLKVDMQALSMTIAKALAPGVHLLFTMLHTELTKLLDIARLLQLTPMFQQLMFVAKLLGFKEAPAPETSAHRLKSSPWEQMGMVIGWGAAENPMKQTAKNTAKSAEYLGQMAQAFGLNRGVARTGSMSLYPINLP